MKEVSIKITPTGFPSQFVADAEKDTVEFGLQVGQAIQYEWFRKIILQEEGFTIGLISIRI